MNLLIVDDNPTNLKLLRAQLESEGHAVFEAHDGVDALALLKRQPVDAVISDILMPRMDGYRLCHEIRTHARLHDLPVILCTSTYTSPSDEKLVLDVGADKYLKRPVSREAIVAALHEVIAQPHAAPRPKALQEIEVFKEYSERLVSKLEEKSTELMAAYEELHQVLAHSPAVLYRLKVDGQNIIMEILSDNMERLLGVARKDTHFEWWKENLHPEDRKCALTVLAQGLKGDGHSMTYRIRHKDGTYRWVEDNNRVVRDASGQPKEMVGVWTDITARKQAEEEVQSRAQELELLYGLSRALAESIDLDQVLDIVNRYVVENIHVTFARIALLEGSNLVMRAAYPIRYLDHDLFVGDQKPASALPYCQRVLEGHELVILHASDPEVGREERTALLLDHVHSLCLVPLRVGEIGTNSGHVLGILMLGEARNEGREPITPQKLHLVRSVGDQAASAIRRMLLRQETDRRLQHLSALSEIDRAITSGFDLNISIETLLAQVITQLGVDAANVLLLDSSSQTLEFFCGQGFRTKAIESTQLRLGVSYAGRAALERVLVHVSNLQDSSNDLLKNQLADENFVSYYGAPLIAKGQVKGVLEIFNRAPFEPDDEWLGFLKALAEQAAIAIDNVMLFDSLTRSNIELSLAYNDTIEGWSHALDLRDKETEGHSLRVTENTLLLARSFGLGDDELAQIRWGALLHDIGKMGVPDNILFKPGPLTDEEWVLMKKHPSLAYELLSPIRYLCLALDIPYCHHEKWDGTGYPRGLKGEQIPLAARFFAVVDVWDALRSDRPYRAAWPEEKVLDYIQSLAGSHFDPQIVKVFLESEVLVGKSQ